MSKDAIGHALLDYQKGRLKDPLIVKSSISEEDEIPVPYLFRELLDLPALEKKALELCRGAVLDVGAASGVHSLILQERGLNTTAIDCSTNAVKVMKQRGVADARHADYFKFKGRFDTLLMLMNGLGIAGTLDNLPKYLDQARKLLNPGGQLLVDSSDIKYMFEEDDGSIWVDLNSRYYGEVTYQMQYGKHISDPFDWLFLDFETLSSVASEQNWECKLIERGDHYDYLVQLTIKS